MMRVTQRLSGSIFLSAVLFLAQCGAGNSAWGAARSGEQEEARPAKGDVPLHVDLKRAQKAAERGDQAEAAGHMDEALLHYQEAAHFAPRDARYIAKEAALRSRIVRSHVDIAERAALEGRMEKATEELRKALHIDPGNAMVAERLTQMNSMEEEPPSQAQVEMTGLPKLQPKGGRQDVDIQGETRSVYEELCARFGIKASFDPDVAGRPVRLRVENVDFYTALMVLGTQTGTFWRALNPALIFVTTDSPQKRKDYGPEGQQVFPLPAAVAPDEMTELLRVLRDITGATHIQLDTRSRTITMRDTPERLAVAGQLIQEVEKARGEVLLDIELLEVDRATLQKLGVTPPTSVSLIYLTPNAVRTLASSTDLANLLTNAQQIFTGQGFSSIPPFILLGGGLSTFLLTTPGATVDFSDSLSLVRSGREVLLRAQDNKPATFFVGDRYPVTLSLLSNSLGTGGTFTPSPTGAIFPQTNFAVGNNPTALVAAPFTGGTLPDLAAVFDNIGTNTFVILQNQDNGNFVQVSPAPVALGANETGQVAIGTGVFRTDSTKFTTAQPHDVILVNSTSNNVSVLLGNVDVNGVPNGTFTEAPGSPIAVGKNPSSIIVADFNGDGIQDFAVSNKADNSISVFRGAGDGTFTQFPSSPFLLNKGGVAETGPVAMVSGTFRQGDMTDLAVVNQTSNNVSILLDTIDPNSNITFTEAPNSPITVGTSPVAIATGDLNADGVGDLVVANQGDNTLSILLGSTTIDGTFTPGPSPLLATATTPAGVQVGSFSGGASPDIVVTNQGQSTLSIFLGLGAGTFQTGVELNVPATPGALIVSQLTSSGLPDVALVAQGSIAGQGVVSIIQDSSALAALGSGTGQTPYPGAEYMDIGLKVKATPALHPNNEVTLQLEFEIRALAGGNINGIPIISNRTLTQTVRVKDDQPTLIGGLTDREETRSITGLPGFAELPGVGYAFGGRTNSLSDTELMILITPHRLRSPQRQTGTIFAGHGERGVTPSTLPSERVQPP
jgi:Bacterial type II and III secretion system protein/FG-GAP-like repeat